MVGTMLIDENIMQKTKTKTVKFLILFLLTCLMMAACGEVETPPPTATSEPTSTATKPPAPTATVTPTATSTPLPTETPTPEPTATPTLPPKPEFGNPFVVFVAPGETDFQLYGTRLDQEPVEIYPITKNDGATFYPTWSPDGMFFAYLVYNRQSQQAFFHLYDMLAAESKQISKQAVQVIGGFCWTFDGEYLVWGGPQPNGAEMDIYRMEISTGTVTNLTRTSPVWDAFPACSPVSNQISFVSDRVSEGEEELDNIWVMDIDGKNLLQLTAPTGWENNYPGWSPDGKEIAFLRSGLFEGESGGPRGLWAVKVDGSGERLIAELDIILPAGLSPAWSPDSKWIAYNSGLAEEIDLYIVSSEGGKPVNMSNLPGRDDEVSWSSSSAYLLFTNTKGESTLVYLVQISDPKPAPMVPQPGNFMAKFGMEVKSP